MRFTSANCRRPARLSYLRLSQPRFYFCSSDGNPAFVVAFISALVSVFASSNVTTASFFSYRTSTLETPSILFNAFLTVTGHAGHVMPGTFRITVFDAAQAEELSNPRLIVKMHNCRLFKQTPFSIEETHNVRITDCHDNQSGADPKQNLVNASR